MSNARVCALPYIDPFCGSHGNLWYWGKGGRTGRARGSGMTHWSVPIGMGRRGSFKVVESRVMGDTVAAGAVRVGAMANLGHR